MLNEHFVSNKDAFRHEFTIALFDFVDRWFSRTKNKRSFTYKRIMNKVFELIQNVEEQLAHDEEEEEEEEEEGVKDDEEESSSSFEQEEDEEIGNVSTS